MGFFNDDKVTSGIISLGTHRKTDDLYVTFNKKIFGDYVQEVKKMKYEFDGVDYDSRLDEFKARWDASIKELNEATDKVTYLRLVVEKAKSDPAYRALLEVGI